MKISDTTEEEFEKWLKGNEENSVLAGEKLLHLAEETDNAGLRNKAVNAMCSGNFEYPYAVETWQTPCFSNIPSNRICKIAEKGLEKDTMVKLLHRLAKELEPLTDEKHKSQKGNILRTMDNLNRINTGEFYLHCEVYEQECGGETAFDVKLKKEEKGLIVTEIKDKSEYKNNFGWEFNPNGQHFEGLSIEEFRHKIEHMYDNMDEFEGFGPHIRSDYISAETYYEGSKYGRKCGREKDNKIYALTDSMIEAGKGADEDFKQLTDVKAHIECRKNNILKIRKARDKLKKQHPEEAVSGVAAADYIADRMKSDKRTITPEVGAAIRKEMAERKTQGSK